MKDEFLLGGAKMWWVWGYYAINPVKNNFVWKGARLKHQIAKMAAERSKL